MNPRVAARFCLALAQATGLIWVWWIRHPATNSQSRIRRVSAATSARPAFRSSASSDADRSPVSPSNTHPAPGEPAPASASGSSANPTDSRQIIAAPEFNLDRGFYETNIRVEIRCATPGAVIRYTTDSSEPVATKGFLYTNALCISKTTVLRAVAFKPGWAPARVSTRTYIFPTDVIPSRVMRTSITKDAAYGPRMRKALLGVPSLSLATPVSIRNNDAVKGSLEWLAPDGSRGFQEDCGVRYYGGDFTHFDKKISGFISALNLALPNLNSQSSRGTSMDWQRLRNSTNSNCAAGRTTWSSGDLIYRTYSLTIRCSRWASSILTDVLSNSTSMARIGACSTCASVRAPGCTNAIWGDPTRIMSRSTAI